MELLDITHMPKRCVDHRRTVTMATAIRAQTHWSTFWASAEKVGPMDSGCIRQCFCGDRRVCSSTRARMGTIRRIRSTDQSHHASITGGCWRRESRRYHRQRRSRLAKLCPWNVRFPQCAKFYRTDRRR